MDFETIYFIVMSIAAVIEIAVFIFLVFVVLKLYTAAQKIHSKVTDTIDRGAEYAKETKEGLGKMIGAIIDYYTYKIISRRRR